MTKRKEIETYRQWHKNGKLILEYSMKNGKLNGLRRGWTHTGQLITEEVYCMGIPQLIRKFSTHTGKLAVEVTSDGTSSHQKSFDGKNQRPKESFVVKGASVGGAEYFEFLRATS